MRLHTVLRDGNVDGSGAGGTSAPVAPTGPTSAPATTPAIAKSQTDVWGGQPAPDWMKANALGKVHDKTNEAAGVPTEAETDPLADAIAAGTPAVAPAVVSSPVTPVAPIAPIAPTALSPDQLSRAYADAYKTAFEQARGQAPQAPGQPPLSDAQLAQQLGVFSASAEDYEAAFGVKPTSQAQLDAYNRHLQGIAKQAVTIGQVLVQRQLDERQSAVAPYITILRTQEATRLRNEFFDQHKDLAGYEALVNKEYQAVMASGQKFPNAPAVYKFLADRTRETLKSIGITPAAAAARTLTTPAASAPQTTRKMTTTSVGGRSGGSSPAQKPTSTMTAVWGTK